jgi:tetratricopeptide (TPR) repeat protein
MSAAAHSRFEAVAAMARRIPLLGAWLAGELRLRLGTAMEIRDLDRRHAELVRRYGLGRVLAFYDEELIPAADRLPAGAERWQLWRDLGCRTVSLLAGVGDDRRLAERVERLLAELSRARLADDPGADRDARRATRTFLSQHLASAAERLQRRREDTPEALHAYAALDRLGEATSAQRFAHARLRWRLEDRSPEALQLYLRARQDDGAAKTAAPEPTLAAIDGFVEESLVVGEQLPRGELAERLFLNQLALCSPRPPRPAWRNAGLAYLRLGQPARALPYLERACAANGTGGASAFYLGQARFEVADYPGSSAAFTAAAEHGYSKLRIAAWQGLAYARLAQPERALATFRQAEAAAGESQADAAAAGELYLAWGRASLVLGDVAEATRRFRQAAAGATEPRALYGLALCRESSGEDAAGVTAALREIVDRFPRFAPALARLGCLLDSQGDSSSALPCLRQAVELSPWDPEYSLSLGLALERAGDPQALGWLEQAAEGGAGGPEVLRRVAATCLLRGELHRARRWLAALAAAMPESPVVAELQARERVSRAIAAFNTGRYGEAAALWEEVAADRPGDPATAERLAQALVHAASARLRDEDSTGVAQTVERAFRLAPEIAGCRMLHAVASLLTGDFDKACAELRELAGGQPQRPELALLGAVAALLAGDDAALAHLDPFAAKISAGPAGPAGIANSPHSLLSLLRALRAAAAGRFEEAAQECEDWLERPGAAAALGLPLDRLNVLAATIKLRGARRKRHQVIRYFEGLDARDGAGSWATAVAFTRQFLATDKGFDRAGEADAAELAACRASYRALLAGPAAAAGEAVAMRQPLLERFARLLLFLACHHVQRGQLPAALDALAELQTLSCQPADGVDELEQVLRRRLSTPSHAGAFALLVEDAEAARQTWEALLEKDPRDLLARHHLACLAWSRAYDTVLAGRVEDSLAHWRAGLEHFRQLYASDAYWQGLRQKGRALGGSTMHPFDETAFDTWRRDAVYRRGSTLLDLIFHLLAGADLAQARPETVLRAKALMELLRAAGLDAATCQRLAAGLADHYLDPDPTRVPDLALSRRRAEVVLDVDPANLYVRTFLVRSVTHEVATRIDEKDRDFAGMARQLAAAERHAEALAAHRGDLPAELHGRAASDLAAYYDQFGTVKHQEGQLAVSGFNKLAQASPQARSLLEQVLRSYRDSDRWFERSIAVDPVNVQAKQTIEEHRIEYPKVEKILRDIRRMVAGGGS